MFVKFLEMKDQRHEKQDYYMAQIAAEVRRANVQQPKRVQIEHLLLSFRKRKASKKEVSVEAMTKSHKRFWFAHLGLKSDGSS